MKHFLIIIFVAAISPAAGIAQESFERALDALVNTPTFPKFPTGQDRDNLAVLDAAPAGEAAQAILDAFAANLDAPAEYGRVFATYLSLGNKETKLIVARAMAGKAEAGQNDPFIAFLADSGDSADLPLVLQKIKQDPNGQGTVLARQIVSRKLPDVLLRLEELSVDVPGTWTTEVDRQLGRQPGTLQRNYQLRLDSGETTPVEQSPQQQEGSD